MSHDRSSHKIAVIGAGIVGCATTLTLAAEGHTVTAFDPGLPGAGASFGNAGAIVTGSVTPTATPGVLRMIPRYLLDRDGPAVLRWRHLPAALPWLWRFLRAGRPAEVERISNALIPLVTQAIYAYRPLLKLASSEDRVTQAGWLKVYATEAQFQSSALERRLQAQAGISLVQLDRAELLDLEPKLAPDICYRGLFQPHCGFVRDPKALAEAFMTAAQKLGARHIRASVDRIRSVTDGGIEVQAGGRSEMFDKVVVAAGAWSARFARDIGDPVRLDAERGYHMVYRGTAEGLLTRPVVFPGMGMVLSPMAGGLRILNGTELAGMDAAPDFRRIRLLRDKARQVLPDLGDARAAGEWMGHRPSTPDSLPVIGRSPRNPNVVYAFGHGHLGLTLAARTAGLVAQAIMGAAVPNELVPCLIDRFGLR
jgi:D-amino-acid dehydrogenase